MFCIACLLLPVEGWAQTREAPTVRDVEGMYARAKATLEDRTIPNVEQVPMLLETCTRMGYAPAARLLMDVHEGKFKGLDAHPELAFRTAHAVAQEDWKTADEDLQLFRTEAMFRLALYLERGYGCKADAHEAFRYMNLAAERGYAPAKAELARYLFMGKTETPAPQKAWKLLTELARTAPETPHVFFYMGYICYQGMGQRPDRQKAAQLFHMGVQMNDADCMNNLGAMLEKGIGTKAKPEAALMLYRKAAALGHKRASANMQRLAYLEGAKAKRATETPPERRIRNALMQVVRVLPLPDDLQRGMQRRLQNKTAF